MATSRKRRVDPLNPKPAPRWNGTKKQGDLNARDRDFKNRIFELEEHLEQMRDRNHSLVAKIAELERTIQNFKNPSRAPEPALLWCPLCHTRHVDEGEFATKPHRNHACQKCGLIFRTLDIPTVGVEFLPNCKNQGMP